MESPVRGQPLQPDERRCYGDDDGATVTWVSLGKGEIIWWADSGPLTNHGLTQASNSMLFLNSVGLPRESGPGGPAAGAGGESSAESQPTRVLWDEYFHGERLGFWDYLGKTPVPWLLLQMGVLFTAVIFTYGRQSGPLRPPQVESRLSPLEFVETLGDLYWRKGAAAGALEVAYHRFRLVLLRRLGLPATVSAPDLYQGVRERLGWTVPGFWETLQGCERGIVNPEIRDAESLHLIQELHDYTRRFGLRE